MSYSLTVLNYLKVAKLDQKTGLAPIFLRVTIGDQRMEISAKRSWDPTRWETEVGKAKGTKEDARTLNTYLDTPHPGPVASRRAAPLRADAAAAAGGELATSPATNFSWK